MWCSYIVTQETGRKCYVLFSNLLYKHGRTYINNAFSMVSETFIEESLCWKFPLKHCRSNLKAICYNWSSQKTMFWLQMMQLFSKIVLDDCMWLCSIIMFGGNISFQRDSTSKCVSVSEWMYVSMHKKVAMERSSWIKITPEFLELRMRNLQGIIFISTWVSREIFKSAIV